MQQTERPADSAYLTSLEHNAPPQTPTPSSGQRLGSTWGITQDDRPLSLFDLQRLVRKTLPGVSAGNCCVHRRSVSGIVSVRLHVTGQGEQVASYDGLLHCGNVWTCPLCANRVAKTRRDEIADVLSQAKERGYRVYFLSLTVRHSLMETLDGLRMRFANARRVMRNRRKWKMLASGVGIVGYIRGIEVTYGEFGWHYHSHEILICSPDGAELDESTILTEWQAACKASHLGIPTAHGVDLQRSCSVNAAGYPVKSDLQEEITSSMFKTSNGNYTPWGMLALGAKTGSYLLAKFAEYAKTMPGTKRIMFSRGLRQLFDLGEPASDQEVVDEKKGEAVFYFRPAEWDLIIRHEKRKEILDLFTHKTVGQAIVITRDLLISLQRIEPGRFQARKRR